jgi:quaternary ammonium compound-resistance protein SugE
MGWIYLLLAGLLEIGFTTALRFVDRSWPVIPIVTFAVLSVTSFVFLSLAIRTIPLGTAYAVWTGIGAAGTVLIGLAYFNEPMDTYRMLFLMLLIGSIVGLKFVSAQ